ncbi:polyprenyl synthetase family protein [Streptomyces globisporus]|uniref:polyprenyl synthetase family protein n=1 Tax=Streptomyces globisporus TaxID=1908 RepID=UPI000AC76DC1|nr:polyprenyl synthetase family protein [Streptomyces globisporus]
MTKQHRPARHSTAPVAPATVRDRLLDRVEARIGDLLTAEHTRWSVTDRHAATLVSDVAVVVRGCADRIRPVLFLTGYLAAGGDPEARAAVDAAAALELLDTCWCIRGDTRDGAVLRRGLPALHVSHAAEHERNGWRGESRRFGESTAVLAGDLTLAYADRLTVTLPEPARDGWERLRAERVLGAHGAAAAKAAYRDDAWPGDCAAETCSRGCAAGWYAVERPLTLGAELAGRPDLVDVYREYGAKVHAAWRLSGFLSGGPDFDDEAELTRDLLLDEQGRREARAQASALAAAAARVTDRAPLTPAWRDELTSLAGLLAAA